MQKQYRMQKNGQFRYVYRKGKHVSNSKFSLNYIRAMKLQAGFVVSKKVGNAVIRNRVKRRLRECFRLKIADLQKGFYVFTAKPEAKNASYQELEKEMLIAFKRLSLYKVSQ